ncbi:DUF427 domain-containing protein [Phaeacidiphilus oryzae]|jgi:uncharacterized protein (DUF427 family)|uniref:DUF427 domain-containing protein n=1 Tax=Phaeacidiphilus oryzae TaxID=348818 RepID=UPI000561DD6A|nr:DUF427 domain-containing protein [Phaeacidiphilus oryzae]
MARETRVPGPDHPITIEKNPRRVVVRAGGAVVADTRRALTLSEGLEGGYPPVQYIPLEDVDPAVLTGTESHTYCPYKGEASYYSLRTGDGQEIADAVWTYPEPHPAVAEIAGHVAFYPKHVTIDQD